MDKTDNRAVLPEWKIPVTWSVCGFVKIQAETLADAMIIAKDDDGILPLPTDSDYIDGSWELSEADVENVRELYNNNQKDITKENKQ